MIAAKRQIRVLLMACVMAGVCACTNSYRPADDTLVVALESQPLTLDPRFATDATGIRIGALIFSGLVRVGDNLEILPDAAESWVVNGRTYTFYLRPGLKFHNGRPVQAEDLLFTWEFYRSAKSPFASSLRKIKTIAVQEVEGRIRVDILVEKKTDNFLLSELPSVKILPKAEVQAQGDDFAQTLIGTGPFRFVGQNLNEIRLKAVSAKTENLVFKVVRDDFTRYQKMLKGEVDVAQNVLPTERVAEFQRRADEFHVITYPGLNMVYILINHRDEALKDRSLRLALAHAVDRQSMIKFKLSGLATPATSILSPQNFYFNPELTNPAYDMAQAQGLVRPHPLRARPLVIKTANNPAAIDNGRVLANQFQQAGLNVKHESYEWATYYDDVKKGNFQLAVMKWVGIVDPDIYRDAFHSRETPPGRNRGAYRNSEVDRLLDQGMEEENRNKRRQAFLKVQKIVHQDLAIIPLWYDRQVAIARKNVRNYKPIITSDYWPLTQVSKDR